MDSRKYFNIYASCILSKIALIPFDRIILFQQVDGGRLLDNIKRVLKNPYKGSSIMAVGSGMRLPSEQLSYVYFKKKGFSHMYSSCASSVASQVVFYPFDVLRSMFSYSEQRKYSGFATRQALCGAFRNNLRVYLGVMIPCCFFRLFTYNALAERLGVLYSSVMSALITTGVFYPLDKLRKELMLKGRVSGSGHFRGISVAFVKFSTQNFVINSIVQGNM